MNDRNSDGRFSSKVEESRGRFRKGRGKTGGRVKGTPNKVTRAVKDWLVGMVDKVDIQDAIEERIKKGDAIAFFRALEHVIGKPAETQRHEGEVTIRVYKWQE